MSEVDISEDLPNGDDSAFTEDRQQTHDGSGDRPSSRGSISAGHGAVFVATSQGLLAPEEFQEAASIKTTHIVIHDESGLKTPTTPLPPPTPATPLSREKGFRYQWDEAAHQDNVLPVRCKNTNGELHKDKFGSGGRGRCIKSGDTWYTPNEFENACGRASSKDWKRSIRYGGRTLQCLIEDGILHPHATSCTCAACCDDESVTGPVRLFVPYKRRKKESESGPPSPSPKKARLASSKSPNVVPAVVQSPIQKVDGTNLVESVSAVAGQPVRVGGTTVGGEAVQIVTTDAAGNIVTGDTVVALTPVTLNSKTGTVLSMDVSDQKTWWQLEEMVTALLQQAQQLKLMIEQAKTQSIISRETAIQAVKQQMEKALSSAKLEAQVQLSRAIMEERAQKELAVQQAVAQTRAEMQQEKSSETLTVVTYDSSWAAQPGTQNNITGHITVLEEVDSDTEKK